jgi:hypothetical protein
MNNLTMSLTQSRKGRRKGKERHEDASQQKLSSFASSRLPLRLCVKPVLFVAFCYVAQFVSKRKHRKPLLRHRRNHVPGRFQNPSNKLFLTDCA